MLLGFDPGPHAFFYLRSTLKAWLVELPAAEG